MGVILLRTVIVYLLIVFSLRVMGKRQLGELQPSELVVTILVSDIATLAIQDMNMPLMGSVLPIFLLVICEVLVSFLILKSGWAQKFISGSARIVIRDGKIDQAELRNLRWTIDDLIEQLRGIDIFDISEVSFAMVETSGSVSAYKKFASRPVTAKMMQMQPANETDAPPMVLISDGVIVYDALRFLNLRPEWLEKTLEEEGCVARDVFLMTCDRRAQYHIVLKEEKRRKGSEKARRETL